MNENMVSQFRSKTASQNCLLKHVIIVWVCICLFACAFAWVRAWVRVCAEDWVSVEGLHAFHFGLRLYTSLSNCLILSESVCLPNRKYILERYMLRQRPCDHGSPVEDHAVTSYCCNINTHWRDLPLAACNRLDVKPPEILCFWPLSLLDLQLQ